MRQEGLGSLRVLEPAQARQHAACFAWLHAVPRTPLVHRPHSEHACRKLMRLAPQRRQRFLTACRPPPGHVFQDALEKENGSTLKASEALKSIVQTKQLRAANAFKSGLIHRSRMTFRSPSTVIVGQADMLLRTLNKARSTGIACENRSFAYKMRPII